jgi:DNA-binding response OmpR family regulator
MPVARPILVVEDDDVIRWTLREYLASTGVYQPIEAPTLSEARCHLNTVDARVDLVLLDITLPDGSGRDFCAELRQQGVMTPIIMLTGAAGDDDVVRGLDAGANDYIVKPFRDHELLARVRAQLRIYDAIEDAVFSIGPHTFRPAARLLMRGDTNQRIRLSIRETDILKYLYRAGNHITSRETLLEAVFGYHCTAKTHTVETHIYRLRQKIEIDPADPRLLVTRPGGYRLNITGNEAEPHGWLSVDELVRGAAPALSDFTPATL